MSSLMTSLRKAISVITNNSSDVSIHQSLEQSNRTLVDHEHFDNSLNYGSVLQQQQIPASINSHPSVMHSLEHSAQGTGCNQADLVDARVVENSNSITKPCYVVGYWTPEEDRLLEMLVAKCGERNWARVAKAIRSRNSKQCRERWQNILSPDVKRGDWMEEEDEKLMNAYSKLGSQWAKISKWLPGRTANAIKNHWNANKRKNLAKRNFKHTKLQEYIASKIDPKNQPSNGDPLQSQPNMQNLNGGPINGYSSNGAPLQSQPNMQNLNGAPIHGYPFFLGVGGQYFPVVMLGSNFAFPYSHGPIYRAEGSGSSAGGALIRNQDVQSAEESSEVISNKPDCFCDNGKGKEGAVSTFSI
ncbi:uncharacterized protein LOC144562426 isoform X2 [Carex rostrata]